MEIAAIAINNHFSLEAKLMVALLAVSLVLGLLWAMLDPRVSAGLEVDDCLDSGGSYDYSSCRCDYSTSHEYKEKHQCD